MVKQLSHETDTLAEEIQSLEGNDQLKQIRSADPPAGESILVPGEKPLGVWTSLISAKAMTSFCERRSEAIGSKEIEVMSLEDLAFLDQHHLERYELQFLAVYDRDLISPQAQTTLSRLCRQKSNQSKTPLLIFYCGNSDSRNGRKWRQLLTELSTGCEVRICYGRNEIPVPRVSRLVATW